MERVLCFSSKLLQIAIANYPLVHHVAGRSWRSGGDVSQQFSAVLLVLYSIVCYDVADNPCGRCPRFRSLSHATVRSARSITWYTLYSFSVYVIVFVCLW